MNIVIAGGSGFIGNALIEHFCKRGDHLYILTRNKQNKNNSAFVTYIEWLQQDSTPEKYLKNIDVFINLAGESINSGRWTEKRKKRILSSRIKATSQCLTLIKKLENKPSVFLNASAIGYYGTSMSKRFTEHTKEPGSDFLATVVKKWEAAANEISTLGVRTVLLRFGIVLDKKEGALPKMVLPYKFFIGGTVGSGNQWVSWVHIDDLVRVTEFSIDHPSIDGPLNITSPTPITMKQFGKTAAEVLNRPHWLPLPSLALKILLGEMSMLMLNGQYVYPQKALDHGFTFQYTTLKDALQNILSLK